MLGWTDQVSAEQVSAEQVSAEQVLAAQVSAEQVCCWSSEFCCHTGAACTAS